MTYRIFGAEISPYSVKVRSYFRYKGIPHEWILRSAATQAESMKYAKLPLIPIVATPEDEGIQDSTPILEKMEARFLLFKATKDAAQLEEAHRLLTYLSDHAPEEYRETMIKNVPLHRDIASAWKEHRG